MTFKHKEILQGMTTEYKNDATPRFDLDDSLEEGKGEESDDEDEVLGDYEDIDGNWGVIVTSITPLDT